MSKIEQVGGVAVFELGIARLFKDDEIQAIRGELLELIKDHEAPRVAINLAGVEFISSRGLGVLVAVRKAAVANDGKISLFGASGTIQQVLKTTKLDTLFSVADDQQGAIDAITG